MIKIEYRSARDINDINYEDVKQFRQKMFLDSVMSEPIYTLDEDGVEDSNGIFNAEFQRWDKKYHFDAVVPEYVVDAMMSMMIHTHVYIDDNRVEDIEVDIKWHGRFAKVDITFTLHKVIKGSCCDNMQLGMQTSPLGGGQCYEPNLAPIDEIVSYTSAKYTDPFNNGVSQGIRFLVYTEADAYDASFKGSIFEFTVTGWQEMDNTLSDGVFCALDGDNLYFDGVWWRKYPFIWMVDQAGVDTYHITGYAVPETWVYVSYDDGGGYVSLDPIWAATFNTNGYTVNIPEGDYTWKIDNNTFSCTYNAGNDLYKESGFWLINDGGDYFTQNASNDKWYR